MEQKYKRIRLLFLIFSGAISLALLVVGVYQIYDFTESTAFCGQLCHKVMKPEYTAYQASPHSRVRCADCHVGPGANYLLKSKIAGIPMIWGTLTGNYPKPIQSPVDNLRPARDTCQQCHWPEKFSGEIVKQISNFNADENNTQTDTTIVLNIGSGSSQAARGIHWHVAAEIYYVPMDKKRMEIGEVWTVDKAGNPISYIDPDKASAITPELIKNDKRLMDCVDCHNRATHIFYSPESLIDTALTQGKIDKTLPYVKKEALSVLDPVSSSLDEAYIRIESVRTFYQSNYPSVFAENKTGITNLVSQLQEMARLTTFPEMNVDWNTHPDHSGHQSSSGCFRCHGKLVATSGPQAGKVISASCDLCHQPFTPDSVAVVAIPHSLTGRQDCLSCHGAGKVLPVPVTHQGRSNAICTSCHNSVPAAVLTIPHSIEGITDCLKCHGPAAIFPYPSNHAGRSNISCTNCHDAVPVPAPAIPHSLDGRSDCLICHAAVGGIKPVAATHANRTNATCLLCHQPK